MLPEGQAERGREEGLWVKQGEVKMCIVWSFAAVHLCVNACGRWMRVNARVYAGQRTRGLMWRQRLASTALLIFGPPSPGDLPVLTHQAQFGMWNRKDVWNGLNTQVESVRGSNGLGTWNDKRCHRQQAVNTS